MNRPHAATLILLLLCVQATVTSVYDGDSFRVVADTWPGHTWTGSVRVKSVDTPELRARCEAEKTAAQSARGFTVRHVEGKKVILHNVEIGKFAGRVLANVSVKDGDLGSLLIAAGHARPYDGGRRQSWCK